MAEMDKTSDNGRWGNMKPVRRSAHLFDRLVSPLGEDCQETPVYSPSRTVNGAMGQRRGQIGVADERQGPGGSSGSESRRNDRRGG